MPARLQTLGHLRLLDEGGYDIVFPEKALLILSYLRARSLADMSRADAAALFWDDANPATAFANLRQTIARVQKRQRELDRAYLTFNDTSIVLGPEPVESDIEQVRDDAGLGVLAGLLKEDFLKYVKPGNRGLPGGFPCNGTPMRLFCAARSLQAPNRVPAAPGTPGQPPPFACSRPIPTTRMCARY